MMRRIGTIATLLPLMCLGLLASMARAQESAPAPEKGAMQERESRRPPGTVGRIKSIDTEKHILVLESRRQGEITVILDDNTKYSKDGAPIKMSELKEGDFLFVGGEPDAEKKTVKATEVMVRTGPPGGRRPPQ